jgi:hypothetical protein
VERAANQRWVGFDRKTYNADDLRRTIQAMWEKRHTGFGRHVIRSCVADIRRMEATR